MPFQPGQSGNPLGRPKGSCNKTRRAVRDWATSIVEDPQVQARLLADARASKLHPSLLTVLMADAYGKPRDTTTSEPMIPSSEIEEARQSLQVKLQIAEGPIPLQIDDIRRVCLMVEPMSAG